MANSLVPRLKRVWERVGMASSNKLHVFGGRGTIIEHEHILVSGLISWGGGILTNGGFHKFSQEEYWYLDQ